MQMTALDQWYDYVKSHDPGALRNLLHPDAVFEAPSCTRRSAGTRSRSNI